jgi:BirA family biotin operon repressor/biotin-[acetyl-CoA-carboxylase] ligase
MTTKERLLSFLKAAEGQWVSGESISERMAVTRSAIWKHIAALRNEGYDVESSPRKGYLLRSSPDVLTELEVSSGLDTKIIGRRGIAYLREVDSTNGKAKERALAGAEEGTVVIAEMQSEGRGRRKRTWHSVYGKGIYTSLILRPEIVPADASKITLLSSVAAAETIQSITGISPRIKWPNDIMVGQRKLCGILTELGTEMDAVEYIVVGCGMNINIREDEFPEDIRDMATSLLRETGRSWQRIKILRNYLECYERFYDIFRSQGFDPIMTLWRRFENVIGRMVKVDLIGGSCRGKVIDVDGKGILVIENEKKQQHRIISGDVTFL